MGFCDNIVKTFLFITNFLLFLFSCTVLALGIWILVDKPSLVNILDQVESSIPIYDSAVILLLFVASAAILISFFGCCGAYKESRCMLGSYFLMILSLLILITIGTVIGISQGIDNFSNPLKDTLYKYDPTSSRADIKEITGLWDAMQTELHCCGVESARDWSQTNPRFDGTGYTEDNGALLLGVKVPESCCATSNNKARCQVAPSGANGAYMAGCFTILKDEISSHMNVVGGVAITIIIIMVLDLMIAGYMCTCGVGEDRPQKRHYVRPGHVQQP
ncbi:tetraspanin-1 [Eurytemora carolleeae]|uniref:tetraspanin-1 n=1 Tax=Eurytemora carolleeae TaxID=1294199 RepID=UPI000C76AE8C|nr:tetraspanin-1 [Eurytemora carolleeae]|eukprot:XP_023321594.1 tetraspanin-1-like [Eurytemora affinis]